jgi:dihydrofolate synthase/folylpolyglutamate synthase
MFSQIPMYQRTGKAAYKADLGTTLKLDQYFNHPHKQYKTIHVAGTNGKGSVSHALASVLQAAGYRTGLYTSPHLKDYRERIRINGEIIDKAYVVGFVEKHQSFFEEIQPSFFEMSVALAFQYFADKNVDVAIMEVGMGGRLDSTNIIMPEVSVITNIGLDHTAFLGTELSTIAKEKAGVIKNNVPVVVGESQLETKPVFEQRAKEVGTEIYFADKFYKLEDQQTGDLFQKRFKVEEPGKEEFLFEIKTDLLGFYQQKNLATVLKTVDVLRGKDFDLKKEHVLKGLSKVKENTGFAGRWQVLGENPLILCDTAHNREGISINMEQISKMNFDKVRFVLGFVNDKSLDQILSLFPVDAEYYFTKADIPRALDEHELERQAIKSGLHGKSYGTVKEAYQQARKAAGQKDLIYVGGSTFVVSEII